VSVGLVKTPNSRSISTWQCWAFAVPWWIKHRQAYK